MPYIVRLVEDRDLPEGTAWVAADTPERCYLFVKTSACRRGVIPRVALEALRGFVVRRQSLQLEEVAGGREGLAHAV